MNRRFATGLLAVFAAAPLVAQEAPERQAVSGFQRLEVRDSFQAWSAENGGSWQYRLDEEVERASFLFGGRAEARFEPSTDGDFAALARLAIADTSELTGLELTTLVDESVRFLPLGLIGSTDKTTVRFRQAVDGVPVLGAYVNVLFDAEGRMLSLQSTALPGVEGFATSAAIDAERAVQLATRLFEGSEGVQPTYVSEARLAIGQVEASDGKHRVPALVYEVDVNWSPSDSTPAGYTYLMDAGTGAVVERTSNIHYFDVSGTISSMATPGTQPDYAANPETAQAMPYIQVVPSSGPTVVTDANGNFNIPGVAGPINLTVEYLGTFCNSNNQGGVDYSITFNGVSGSGNSLLMNPASATLTTAEANAFQGIADLRDWIRATDPGDATADFQATSNPNISSTCNAYYNGVSVNFYQAGGGCENTSYSTVVAHEMGHWLNDLYGTGNGSDGMGEGNADVFAMYLYDTPLVGEDFCGAGCNVRDGNNATTYCGDGNGGCYGEVHADGEPWMGAAWKVRSRLNTAYGNSAGDMIADTLFIGWMNAYNQTTIHSDIEVQWLTLDDTNGNIDDGTPHYNEIDPGFRDQGFPGYDLSLISITNVTQLPNTVNEAGPYVVDATVMPLLAPSISAVDLFYRVNGGAFTAVAMGNIGGDVYQGSIPGQISPSSVDYYVRATDSLANEAFSPKGAPIDVNSFDIGLLTVVFSDDFETVDDNGWTHNTFGDTSNSQDDWQHGLPNGTSGDPGAAASGSQVWGNDLGPSGWNGAYQDNVHNYLRSPVIDCSSAVNTKLRFQRWLTVEKGIYDQAEVFVNGTQVWSNAPSVDTLDSSWTQQEIDISALADGNPNVTVEFTLTTDVSLTFGGWTIDDVELISLSAVGGPGATACFGDGTSGLCPCGNNGAAGEGCQNSTGVGALLTATGSNQIVDDNVVLHLSQARPDKTAVFLQGATTINSAFKDGILCTGDPTVRLEFIFLDGAGQGSSSVSIVSKGGVGSGQTLTYQGWFRDGMGPCGTGSNLSNGYEITWN